MKINLRFNSRWTMLISSLGISLIFIWFSLNPPRFADMLLQRLNYIAYDLRLNLLALKNPIPKSPVVIVDIDDKSLQKEGRWPWTRSKMASLVIALYDQGATVVAFDMLFPEAEPLKDYIFAKALSAQKNKAILGIFFSGKSNNLAGELPHTPINYNAAPLDIPAMQGYIGNYSEIQEAAENAGAISVIPDQDGTIRRYSLVQRYKNKLYPSLALETARLYLMENSLSVIPVKIGANTLIEKIKLGNADISTDDQGRVFIPYLGPAQTFPYYSATDILNHQIPAQQLQNVIVLIGTSAIGLGDIRSTPVQSVFPGVEIHANIVEALLTGDHFPYVPAWTVGAQFSLLVFIAVSLSILFLFIGPLWIILVSALTSTVIFAGSLVLWRYTQMVFPIILPISLTGTIAIFNMAYGFFSESRRRDELKKVFEQYVPAGRIAEILKNPNAFDMFEGERKVMSVLFMDIRSFTSISEKLNIIELKKLLNFFLTEMTRVIFSHGGTVDKYVGDMIMAFWGAPLPDHEHAKHAISAGLDMLETTRNLQNKLSEMQLPSIRIGIGVNTGMMDVGDMGSTYRRAYTVLGDAVNLASRLESLSKFYGVNMICGENTVKNQPEFTFQFLDKVRVKGKAEGVNIYEPIGLASVVSEKVSWEINEYQQAIEHYASKKFELARQFFITLNKTYPEKILYQLYLNRIENFMNNPPPDDWDVVWEHHEK